MPNKNGFGVGSGSGGGGSSNYVLTGFMISGLVLTAFNLYRFVKVDVRNPYDYLQNNYLSAISSNMLAMSFNQQQQQSTIPVSDPTSTTTFSLFDKVYEMAYQRASFEADPYSKSDKAAQSGQQQLLIGPRRKPFVLDDRWNRTNGGLVDSDRTLLGRLYYEAESVMEYGLGESTFIAAAVGVPRYLGIDSDATWVAQARDKSPAHFQFMVGDIGKTREWGFPTQPRLEKSMLLYEVMPLWSQAHAFDIYFIDGRWRPACVLISFLHASARGRRRTGGNGGKGGGVLVGIHDYNQRPQYHKLEEILEIVEKSQNAAIFQRKSTTTDKQIWDLYMYYDQLCREKLPKNMDNNIDQLRNLGC